MILLIQLVCVIIAIFIMANYFGMQFIHLRLKTGQCVNNFFIMLVANYCKIIYPNQEFEALGSDSFILHEFGKIFTTFCSNFICRQRQLPNLNVCMQLFAFETNFAHVFLSKLDKFSISASLI